MKTLIISAILATISATSVFAGDSTISCEGGVRHVDKFVKNRLYSNFYERERSLDSVVYTVESRRIETNGDHKSWDGIRMGVPDFKTISGVRYTYEWHMDGDELELTISSLEGHLYDSLGEPTDAVWKYKTFTYNNCVVTDL